MKNRSSSPLLVRGGFYSYKSKKPIVQDNQLRYNKRQESGNSPKLNTGGGYVALEHEMVSSLHFKRCFVVDLSDHPRSNQVTPVFVVTSLLAVGALLFYMPIIPGFMLIVYYLFYQFQLYFLLKQSVVQYSKFRVQNLD